MKMVFMSFFCNNSSIVCPHYTFKDIKEAVYYCNFENVDEKEELRFSQFVTSFVKENNLSLSMQHQLSYCSIPLSQLIHTAMKRVFHLPVQTLIKLNGMRRLKDTGYIF